MLLSGTPETRRAAACQIGDAAAVRPEEDLASFLRRLSDLLRRGTWETRVAAGEALDKVVGGAVAASPDSSSVPAAAAAAVAANDSLLESHPAGRLALKQLDVQLILTKGTSILVIV